MKLLNLPANIRLPRTKTPALLCGCRVCYRVIRLGDFSPIGLLLIFLKKKWYLLSYLLI
jgi:hypothetical protein